MKRIFILGILVTLGISGSILRNFMTRFAEVQERLKTAAQQIAPSLKTAVEESSASWGAPVFIRAFKEERELEVWIKEDEKETFTLLRTYPIVAASGTLGPKLAEGDRQVPEGFYFVPPSMMNPHSRFHLAFNIGYPNEFDQAHGRTGTFIMVHGSNVSIGCLAMTDDKIEEIYSICDAAFENGQRFFRVHIFPFRMSEEKLALHANSEWSDFWGNLLEGYQWFEDKKAPPNIILEEKRYVIDEN
ncbi:murein L,D-transpeptidase [Akkermansiaceae bacterium]|nr:murein L,D-transpeptidase [Akkermansiaceae bacterium]